MPPSPQPAPVAPRSILVRGVNWLGDAVMTTPALQRLRERFPEASITLVTPEKLADLWQHHPGVDEVITFRPGENVWRVASRIRGWKFIWNAAQFERGRLKGEQRNLDMAVIRSMQFFSLLGDFAQVPFDLALVLPNSPRSAFECWLARIPQRIGYVRPWRTWTLTRALPQRPGHAEMRKKSKKEIHDLIARASPPAGSSRITDHAANSHQIHEYLHLVASLGASAEPLPPRLQVTDAEVETARATLLPDICSRWPQMNASEPEILALNPGAAYGPAKRWPAERFAAVAREVCSHRPQTVWIVLGGPEDKACCEEIVRLASTRALDLSGTTTLRELMALLKLSRVLLTSDSGPMHVAAALGIPVVVPFGSTSFQLTGPGLPEDPRHCLLTANAACSPCFLPECPIDFRCMTGISVGQVTQAIMALLAPKNLPCRS